MKKTLLALLCSSALLGSCTKATDKTCSRVEITAPAEEVATLQAYISSKGISAVADTRGFFYTISSQGSQVMPTACSNVKVSYTLRLSNGTEVEAANGAELSLGRVIPGWQEGVPLIGEGGSITLYLPPSLGYGSKASASIPANSILVFYIDLLDVI